MFKKFSYLASVSILASMVMTQTGQAMDESERKNGPLPHPMRQSQKNPHVVGFKDHKDVLSIIDEFYNLPISSNNNPAEEEGSTAWQVLNGLKYCASKLATPVGHGVRWAGDQVRGDTFVGGLFTTEGLKLANQVAAGSSAAGIVEEVTKNEGVLKSIRVTTGNSMRAFGALLTNGETPTLSRALRGFWIESKYADKPEEILTNTACALFLSTHISGVNHITQAYRDMVESWNSSSWTTHSLDPALNQEYFIKGIIKGYVVKRQKIDDFFVNYMDALNVDLAILPVTKKITAQSITEQHTKLNKQLLANEVEGKVKEARHAAFLHYAGEVYKLENGKYEADQFRNSMLNKQPVAAQPAIENTQNGNPAQPLALGWKPEDGAENGAVQGIVKNENLYEIPGADNKNSSLGKIQ